MDQLKIGTFIAKKRKEQQLTQEELANQLGISNKSVSKWETGKSIPDLSIHKELCSILQISISELLEGKEMENAKPSEYDARMTELLNQGIQSRYQRNLLIGIVLLLVGRLPIPYTSNQTPTGDFIEGFGTGLSIVITILGMAICTFYFIRLNKVK